MHKVFIIAEAEVNHNGDVGLALELVGLASEACADAGPSGKGTWNEIKNMLTSVKNRRTDG